MESKTNNCPRVSIITVTRNSDRFLRSSIESVISQCYSNIEHIIIDGMSEDLTIDIIKEYEKDISYWISEPDSSMYDAINKGISKSTGEIIAVLNSDDRYYEENTISNVVNFMQSNNIDGVYGDLLIDYGQKLRVKKVFQVSFQELLESQKGTFVPHPTLFLKRKFISEVGTYNLAYKYAADFDFILRCLRQLRISYCGFPITVFRRHAGSITASGVIKGERIEILKSYGADYARTAFWRVRKRALWIKYYARNINLRSFFVNRKLH